MPKSLLSVHGRRGLIHGRSLPAGRQAAPCKRVAALCQIRDSVSTVAEAAYGVGAAQCVDAFCDRGALFAREPGPNRPTSSEGPVDAGPSRLSSGDRI